MRLLFLVVCLLFSSCSQKSFDRAEYLFRYFSDIQNKDLVEESEVIILQNGVCGACDIRVYAAVGEYLENSSKKTYILQSERNVELEKKIGKHNNIFFLSADDKDLRKYGLSGAMNYWFKVKNNQILDWMKFDVNSIDDFRKMRNSRAT